ncbi:TlpA family protein disulfide reductase [Thiomicrospira microaerophila]|uniref:TlpA disulfide reductase family protein n=1 Tax=Thiomicrospira microaerophila TaxID=406020 RepID=UPI00200C5847|nr:TlpA disulfide reductase family protein [Thiomicrospira microaerophila]UQB42913.1 TlpA family protein disulfide reductase [Thiomicrospira microaerophila]
MVWRDKVQRYQAWCLAFMLSLALSSGIQAKTLTLSETTLSVQISSPSIAPVARVLWLVSEYGVLSAETQLANQLTSAGLESWQVDLFEPLFLSPTARALDEIPTQLVAELIEQAHQDDLPLFIIAPNKAAQLAVRGLQNYQKTPKSQLALILLNPNLYLATPSPGELPVYWPHTKTLNLPTWVIQAELSPWRWQLIELQQQLAHSGSPVFLQLMPQVRDRFYFRPDALDIELATQQQLSHQLLQAMQQLTSKMHQARASGALAQETPISLIADSISDQLQKYQGSQQANFDLVDLNGVNHRLNDYQGKVVLLNFWASWCPPCLHEMPSMTRLKSLLSDQPFEILAVNLAEHPEDFAEFLTQNPVNFPILLDPQGLAIQNWRIIAYPTTYLIDQQGKIRYALFGGTEWDQPHHIQVIQQLLNNP